MGLPLFWMEVILTVLVTFAALLALCQRLPGFGLRLSMGLLLLLLITIPASYMGIRIWTAPLFQNYALVPGIIAIGALGIFVFGFRPFRRSIPASARSWSPARLFLVAGLGTILSTATLLTMINAQQAKLASLRAEALALAAATSPPAILDQDDAAPLYEAAREMLLRSPTDPGLISSFEKWTETGRALDPADPGLEAYVKQQAAGLQLVRQAVRRPGMRPIRPLGEGDPVRNDLRQAATALSLSARYHAATQKPGPAVQDVADLYRVVGHQVGSSTNMREFIDACASESVTTKTLEVVLSQTQPKVDDLAPLLDLPPILYRSQFRRSLAREKANVLDRFQYARIDYLGNLGFGVVLLDQEVDNFNILFRIAYAEMEKDYPGCLKMWPTLQKEVHSTSDVLLTPDSGSPMLLPYSPLSRMVAARLMPPMALAAARSDASRRLAHVAIAAARYLATEGKWPGKPEDLVPQYLLQMPLDPYDGQALKMKADGKGVEIFSVGQDAEKRISLKLGTAK